MVRRTKEELEVNVGEVIRRLRLGCGMSVRALAAKANFSPSFISQVELGQVSPSIVSLARIATALDVSLVDLFDERTRRRKTEHERERLIEQLRKANAQLVLSSIPTEAQTE